MMRLKFLVPIAMLTLIVWVGLGCSNADNLNSPVVPTTGGDPSDPMDPNTPVPFSALAEELGEGYNILDFAFEKDGDLAISESSSGIWLFDTFGEFKRNLSDQSGFDGLVDVIPGAWDSGRGIIATGTPVIGCGWTSFYDDLYVTGGTLGPGAPLWWLGGAAHPPG